MTTRLGWRLSIAIVLAIGVEAQPRDLVEAKPETVGFSSQRLDRLHAVMQKYVDEGQMPGIVTILARHGKIVDSRAYGKRDMAAGTPMDKDTIVRIYSMTKPITGVAMMMLYEQGKWNPADPVAKYIPEFANLKVYKSMGADGGGAERREQPVDGFQRTSRYKGQRAMQLVRQALQRATQFRRHVHAIGRARQIQQCAVNIEEESRVAAHRRHHQVSVAHILRKSKSLRSNGIETRRGSNGFPD